MSQDTKDILVIAAWLGMATGLVEGVGLWILQRVDWLGGPIIFLGASVKIIWISMLFDLILFGVLGVALGLAARFLPRLPLKLFSIGILLFLTCYDWLALLLVGHIARFAIVILAVGLATQFVRWFCSRQDSIQSFWRRSLVGLAALSALAWVGIEGGLALQERIAVARLPVAAPGAPNILVIVVDTLRADHLSGYGYSRLTSPNLDRIAEQGVLFEDAFSTSSWTLPSHASLLTGLYPYEHRADSAPLGNRYPTIGEALQAHGYRTAAFSGNYDTFSRVQGLERGFIHFEDYYCSLTNMATNTLYGRLIETDILHKGFGLPFKIDRKSGADINRAFLRWTDHDQARPFFALLNYYDVHAPYVPPQPYRDKFSHLKNPGGLINTDWDMMHIYVPMTAEQLQGEVDAYDGGISYVDDQIGQLLEQLASHGFAENTLVVITSDHGELFGEYGLLEHHNSLYPGVIQVPLIFWWPGHIPEQIRVQQPVSNVGLPVTLLDLIGEREQTVLPSLSLAQLWQDPAGHPDWPYPVAEVVQVSWVPPQHLTFHGAIRSVLSPQWQYIVHEKLGEELYDRRVDPKEAANLAKIQDLQPTMDQFRAHLEMLTSSPAVAAK